MRTIHFKTIIVFGLMIAVFAADPAAAKTKNPITSITPTSARPDETVTITGNGFGGPNVQITVGGVRAQVIRATGNRATFVVPHGVPVGPTTVTVKDPGGQGQSIGFQVLEGVLLQGDSNKLAQEALVNRPPVGVDDDQIQNGVILTRLDVVIAANATVGQINAALATVGGGIVSMRPGFPAMTVAIPRQNGPDGLNAVASILQAQPGIRLVLLAEVATLDVGPPPPADADADFLYLQEARFPAAWNATNAAPSACESRKVTVIVADSFQRPVDVLYTDFSTQVPGVTDLGNGSVSIAEHGLHGYDVLTTLAAKLDATVPTGANPFPECLDLKALQVVGTGLSAVEIVLAIDDALAATAGKVVVNASYGFGEQCGDPINGIECPPENSFAARAIIRAVAGALERASLQSFADRVLVTSAAGNEADKLIAGVYPGAGLARVGSAFNVAATADSAMSFATDTTLWEPTVPCPIPPCLPSLTATPDELVSLNALLAELGQAVALPADNVIIVGSVDIDEHPSSFSEPGAHVFAVGEGIPTLLGTPTQGTSFAAPQVAGLAAYLWMLSPELRNNRPVQDTIAAIEANTFATGSIDAYATVLSLDEATLPTPTTAPIRMAILDINNDTTFDEADIQVHLDNGVAGPRRLDYSRSDLNGDGAVGGSVTFLFDLDRVGSTQFGETKYDLVTQQIEGQSVDFDETRLTDQEILCYYAYSELYTGDPKERDARLKNICTCSALQQANAARRALLADQCEEIISRISGGVTGLLSCNSDPFLVFRVSDGQSDSRHCDSSLNGGTSSGSISVSVGPALSSTHREWTLSASTSAFVSGGAGTISPAGEKDVQAFVVFKVNQAIPFRIEFAEELSSGDCFGFAEFTIRLFDFSNSTFSSYSHIETSCSDRLDDTLSREGTLPPGTYLFDVRIRSVPFYNRFGNPATESASGSVKLSLGGD